ncbi:DUF3618 domain-containing protein [Streptomyces sp. NPDC020917]|uniref:DUF3618 domain-containing protein n=1 Tax=Streptomyces sp. NPDC020917 TaxID=3365102 RepID=UPI0037B5EA87
MSQAEHHTDPAMAELERQIAETREQLGQTVEELAAKMDVPGRAKAKASETATWFRQSAQRAEDRTRAAAAQAADRVKHGAGHGGRHGRHAAGRGGKGTAEEAPAAGGGTAAATAAGAGHTADGSGAHRVADTQDTGTTLTLTRQQDKERLAYGAAAVGLTAATAGAAVWASRHP